MKKQKVFTNDIDATAVAEYRPNMRVSTLISEVRSRFSTRMGQASCTNVSRDRSDDMVTTRRPNW